MAVSFPGGQLTRGQLSVFDPIGTAHYILCYHLLNFSVCSMCALLLN